jgi:hypothetical protein
VRGEEGWVFDPQAEAWGYSARVSSKFNIVELVSHQVLINDFEPTPVNIIGRAHAVTRPG